MKTKDSITLNQIKFTSTTSFPFGTEFRIIESAPESGSVIVTSPSHESAKINIEDGHYETPVFVVIQQSSRKNHFSYVAASSDSIDREAKSIEDDISLRLFNLRKRLNNA